MLLVVFWLLVAHFHFVLCTVILRNCEQHFREFSNIFFSSQPHTSLQVKVVSLLLQQPSKGLITGLKCYSWKIIYVFIYLFIFEQGYRFRKM